MPSRQTANARETVPDSRGTFRALADPMVHTNENEATTTETTIDIKANDPVRNPAASTTNEDIARAEGEGMVPAPPPGDEKVTLRSRKTRRARR